MLDKHEDLLPKEIYWLLQEAESYISNHRMHRLRL